MDRIRCKKAFVATIKEGFADRVRQILQSGAHVNLKQFGPKYMYEAIFSGNIDCVKLFLKAGVDVNNVMNTCNSALLSAVDSTTGVNEKLMSLLLVQGAHVNHANERGQIALVHYIAESYRLGFRVNKRVALMLLAAGELLYDKRVTCYGSSWDKNWGARQVDAPLYLLPEWIQGRTMCLKEFCRETIRKHLKEVDKHSKFFVRIPEIGIPPSLQIFLLYDVVLEKAEST